MSARDLILTLAVVAGGYWLYVNYFQGQQGNYQDMQFEKNEREMRKCIQREERMATMQGNAGLVPQVGDFESFCASQLGMYAEEGNWHKYDTDESDY